MASIPVGFNSDELVPEEDEASLNPFFNAGRRTAAEMVKFAMEDRITSKSRVKNLRDVRGAPATAYTRQLWFNYFCTFVVDVLGAR
jgi:hypothetical protein